MIKLIPLIKSNFFVGNAPVFSDLWPCGEIFCLTCSRVRVCLSHLVLQDRSSSNPVCVEDYT